MHKKPNESKIEHDLDPHKAQTSTKKDSSTKSQFLNFCLLKKLKIKEYFINIELDNGINGINFKMPHGMPYYNYGNEEQILTPCAASSCNTSAGMNCECFHHLNLTLNNIVQVLN